jgi:phage shock protein E
MPYYPALTTLERIQSISTCTMTAIKSLLQDDSTALVDVRTPMEYAQEHLPGAINIPLDEVAYRIPDFEALQAKTILLYCRSGARSGMATSMLHQAGLKNAINGGGISNLQLALH